ncbi:MAG: hypothetical protein WC711_02450 [Candidatus Staskawiczbacteria bacterium]|jgi:hypothetical protein
MTKILVSIRIQDGSFRPVGTIAVRSREEAIRRLGFTESEDSSTGLRCFLGGGLSAVVNLGEIEELPELRDNNEVRICINRLGRTEIIPLQNFA